MEAIYYHVSISGVALKIFPSWDHLEDFSFPQTFHSRQSCKICTIYHLQFDHLIICVSQHQLYSRLTPAMQLLSEVARIDRDPPRTHYIITALQVRELIHKSMKPMAAHRSPVGSLQVQHSLQPYQSSAFLRSDKYTLPNLTMSIGRLDQKCRLLERQKNVLCIYECYVWALNYYSSWTGVITGIVMHHLSQNSDFARICSHCHAGSQKLFPITQLIVWCQIWLYRLTISAQI